MLRWMIYAHFLSQQGAKQATSWIGCSETDDWKPMPSIGAGVREIRIREAIGAFRVIYVTRFEGVVCVFHCFQKKTQKTRREDIALATQRLKYLMKE